MESPDAANTNETDRSDEITPRQVSALLRRAIWLVKMPVLMIASPILVYVEANELHTALIELSPTQFQTERFGDDYHGQRWLRVEGRLLATFAHVRKKDDASAEVLVPLVPNDWKPGQAVHIVAAFAMPSESVDEWTESTTRSPQCTLTGYVPPGGPLWDNWMFPKLHFEEPVVYINDGDSPGSPLRSLALLALGVWLLVYSWSWPVKPIIAWRRRRREAEDKLFDSMMQ